MWCYSYPYFHESLKVEVDSVPERELATRCSSYQPPSIWSPLWGGRKDTHTLTEILTDAGLYNGMNGSPVQKIGKTTSYLPPELDSRQKQEMANVKERKIPWVSKLTLGYNIATMGPPDMVTAEEHHTTVTTLTFVQKMGHLCLL